MKQYPWFVYGTLRPDCGNDKWSWQGCATALYDGEALAEDYCMVVSEHAGFPYAVRRPGGVLKGALIQPDEGAYDYIMTAFDQLEGYVPGERHSHYERSSVDVTTPDGIVTAWIYHIDPAKLGTRATVVASGDWVQFKSPYYAESVSA